MVKTSENNFAWVKNYPTHLKWDEALKHESSLCEMFAQTSKKYSDRIFIDFLGKEYSYEDIYEYVLAAAHGLEKMGITKGDRVGLMLPNTPYYPIMYFAILKLGAVVVNFNPLYAERELLHQIEDSGVRLMISMDLTLLMDKLVIMLDQSNLKHVICCSMLDILSPMKQFFFKLFKSKELFKIDDENKAFSTFDNLVEYGGSPKDVKIRPDDLAVLQYTGGTTGVPKGAMLSHGNLLANLTQASNWFEKFVGEEESFVAVLPFFHVFAMTTIMLFGIKIGAKIILLPRFDLNQLMKVLHKKRPTIFFGVPTIYTAINNHPRLRKYDLSSIKACISGGAPLPIEVKDTFEKNTGCKLVEGYGLSETSPIVSIAPFEGQYRSGSIGFPMQNTELKIIDIEDHKTEMPIGQKGELWIKGPQLMQGYWNNTKATKESIKQGYFATGDIGYMDQDGYFYIVDRLKDMIIASGYNIYPRNVEEAIYLHPAIEECLVAGIDDEYRGQTVKAYIVLKEGRFLSKEELLAFLKDKLSKIETPKMIEFRPSLPKTMIGKLSRKDVLEEERKRNLDK